MTWDLSLCPALPASGPERALFCWLSSSVEQAVHGPAGLEGWPMSRLGGDGKGVVERTPEPGPPPGAPGAIERLTVGVRELTDKRDHLEGEVEKLRRRIAEAEGEL